MKKRTKLLLTFVAVALVVSIGTLVSRSHPIYFYRDIFGNKVNYEHKKLARSIYVANSTTISKMLVSKSSRN